MLEKKKTAQKLLSVSLASLMLAAGASVTAPVLSSGIVANAASYYDNEKNDSLDSASPFSYNGTVEGEISESDSSDFYAVTLDKAGLLTLNINAGIEALGFIFYDENGNELYNRTDSRSWSGNYRFGWNDVSKKISEELSWNLNKGTYYISLIKFGGCTGKYTLKTSFKGTDETFPEPYGGNNNTMADANKLELNKNYTGFLATHGDTTDFMSIEIPSSGTLRTELSANISTLNFVLYDSEGNVIYDRSDYRSWNNNYHFVWNDVTKLITKDLYFDLTKGTYYISFSNHEGSSGEYNVKYTFTSANESFEETLWGNNNDLANSKEISIGKKYNGQIAINDDTDFYKFNVEETSDISVNINAGISRLSFIVYDSTGNPVPGLNRSAGSSWRDDYRLEWNDTSKEINYTNTVNLQKGTYYICFNKFDGATGKYNFRISYPEAETVTLNKQSITLEKGKTIALTATVLPENTYDKKITWSSSNVKVAKVVNGKVTAVGPGQARIYAKTSNSIKTSCLVKVPTPTIAVTSVKLNKTSASLTKGGSVTLTATAEPSNATNKTITWTTSNSKVATVSNGVVKAVGTGTATITAKSQNGKTATCTVNVTVPVTTLSFNKVNFSSLYIDLGKSVNISFSAVKGKTPYKYAVYYSYNGGSNVTIKSLSTTNKATFKPSKAGKYTITVKVVDAAGKTASKKYTLTVVSNSAALENTSKLSASAIKLGNKVNIMASATGGTGYYQYAFFYRKSGTTKWTTLSNFSSDRKYTFKPAAKGKYDILVKIKDSKGTVKSSTLNLTVTAASKALQITGSINKTTVYTGDAVRISASAAGGTGFYRYGFIYKHEKDTDWTTAKAYSANNEAVISLTKAGKYSVAAIVKDSSAAVAKKIYTVNVKSGKELTNSSKISATSIKLGSSVKLTGAASGGTSVYEYAVLYRVSGDSAWSTIQDLSTNSAVSFKPETRGTYEFCVKASDSEGTVAEKILKLRVK